ncbi:MAG: TetR/AcrR family transcriptional regulator [Solirubrobacteraceae bacterium]
MALSRNSLNTSAQPPTGGSRKAKAAQTEQALKDAARRVLARGSYLDTTISDITTEAGRSVGSFYRHFASKEELLQALLVDWLTSAGEQLSAGDAGDDLSEEAALRARVAVYWHTYREHVPEIRALDQAALVNPRFAEQLTQLRDAQLQTMREHLERLRDAGFDLPGEPAILATAFNALLEGFCRVWLAQGNPPGGRTLSDEEAINTLTGMLRHGLLGPRGPGGSSAPIR